MLENFDADNCVEPDSSAHKELSEEKDMKCVVNQLVQTGVFTPHAGRNHPSFLNPKFPLKPKEELLDWIEKRINI